ncbi:hypothetical protein [Actinomadura mexicana]|uniref:hypothetical protein n=1 Tax=Actinomadura mexicana TaxID=134959 RepID=UPI0015C586AC|nr:hypothetical protein [Actinomadura mexicana]
MDATAESLDVHELVRLENGVPSGRTWRTPWSGLVRYEQLDRQAVLDRVPRLHDAPTVLLACTFTSGMRPLLAHDWLAAQRPDARTARVNGASVTELLREVIAEEPLSQSYELVTVREAGSGRPELSGLLLFPVGSRRGDRESLTLRCEPAGEDGTVFAVMAWSPERGTLSLVSRRRIRLAPGRYRLSAELRGPGRIGFHGLPGPLLREERSTEELVAALPVRLAPAAPRAHLVCAVEAAAQQDEADGGPGAVAARVSRVREVIEEVAAGPRPGLTVSLIAYGSHSYERRPRHGPVDVVLWKSSPDKALTALDELAARPPIPPGHPRAAPVECVLAEVEARLAERVRSAEPSGPGARGAEPERTALLLAGYRPPHPPWPTPGLLPCPAGVDWEEALVQLVHRRRVRVGAICDRPETRSHPAWARITGRSPRAGADTGRLSDLVARLGLGPDEGYRVPFPISEPS